MNNWMQIYHRRLKELGLLRDEGVQSLLQFAIQYDDKATYNDVGELLNIRINEALLKDDPFMPYPQHENLIVPGIFIGVHDPTGVPFHWGYEDQQYSVLLLGAPGSGKTNLAYWIIEALTAEG